MTRRASLVFFAVLGALALRAPRAHAQCNNAIAVTPPTLAVLPWGVVGTPYTAGFSASGSSSGNYFWNGPTAAAPRYGLYLTTAGVGGSTNSVIGTPTAAGAGYFNMTLSVTDWSVPGQCLPTNFYYYFDICSNTVALSPSGGALPSGMVGIPYSTALGASGGSNGIYWQDMGGVPGIALSATGLATNAAANTLVGTPTTAGTFTATLAIADWPNWTQSAPVATQCAPTTYQFSITILGPDAGAPDAGMPETSTPEAGPDAMCMALGGSCATGSDCCNGLECGVGVSDTVCCVGAGSACTQSSDCCFLSGGMVGLTCVGNRCQEQPDAAIACEAVAGNTCDSLSPCCSGLSCTSGLCCASAGTSCKATTDCCGTLKCDSLLHKCECEGVGSSCIANGDCCAGLFCSQGASSGTCRAPCTHDSDCPSGQVCDLGACKSPAAASKGCDCSTPTAYESANVGALALLGLAVTAGIGIARRRRRRAGSE